MRPRLLVGVGLIAAIMLIAAASIARYHHVLAAVFNGGASGCGGG